MEIVRHLKYSPTNQTLYVRHAWGQQGRVRHASLIAAVRVAYGLTPAEDPRALPDGMLFSTDGYRGEQSLGTLTTEIFNDTVELPVIQIVKTGPLEVQVLAGRELSDDDQLFLSQHLNHGVKGFKEYPHLSPGAYVLTVAGMDDGPNDQLIQEIGVKTCQLLGERWSNK